jgi:hypothetical protein
VKNDKFSIWDRRVIRIVWNNKDEEYELYKKQLNELGIKVKKKNFKYSFLKCKEYFKMHIKKIQNTTDYFIDNHIVSHRF